MILCVKELETSLSRRSKSSYNNKTLKGAIQRYKYVQRYIKDTEKDIKDPEKDIKDPEKETTKNSKKNKNRKGQKSCQKGQKSRQKKDPKQDIETKSR